MKILLQENSLNLRGTSVAVYDYAFFLKQLYNYECFITFNKNDSNTDEKVLNKFKQHFSVIPFNKTTDIDCIIQNEQIDVMYSIKSGHKDNLLTNKIKMCVHAVFPTPITEKHGDVYAYVSKWLSQYCSNETLPYVPHMVNLPETNENFRNVLNIPQNSIVFGRYGGIHTFDIPFVYETINNILKLRKDIYFLFCNTKYFINHPRVIFTNSTSSLLQKVKFINTCDAMLHARYRGETFGLSVLEFMSKHKPIFSFAQSNEKNHYLLLDNQGFLYNNSEELFNLMMNFIPFDVRYKQLENFLPNSIINQFHNIFLDSK